MPNNAIYAIGNEPYCLWEEDIESAASSFLQAIDHRYFEYLVDRSARDLNDAENCTRAATSLRLGLFHATETLFLLIGALLQGGACPHAWVGSCTTSELRGVLNTIGAKGNLLMLNVQIPKLSWANIAKETLRACRHHPDAEAVADSFARIWEILALNHTQQVFEECEFHELPATVTNFLASVFALFPPPPAIDDDEVPPDAAVAP